MSKQSLTEAFNIEKSKPIINDLNDYEIFRDKTKLEELRSRIIQNLIDNKAFDICIQFMDDIFNYYISGYPDIPIEYV